MFRITERSDPHDLTTFRLFVWPTTTTACSVVMKSCQKPNHEFKFSTVSVHMILYLKRRLYLLPKLRLLIDIMYEINSTVAPSNGLLQQTKEAQQTLLWDTVSSSLH